ncbi:Stp1/IreP family PP2C-type Ser/Thr phosphatase [Myxococcota bacterium]|nr:Stp1/IreP family PP2C-type Ser/Thr phosphatase [Myxococcota bacterium]MBU1534306.1 Stp1/IreP family PP2C-type Ser/Thr phosphatase [Myxococcota bacterium]
MDIQHAALTDVGRKRDHNEDNFGTIPDINFFMVADGMGGHAAGEVASFMAVEVAKKVIEANRESILKYAAGDDSVKKYDIYQLLDQAIQSACISIFQESQNDPDKRGMGTTTDILMIVNDRGFIAHVGDSRVYMERMGKVIQLTHDHSLMNELVRRGKFTPEEFLASPYAEQKNALTRAVGVYETIEVDTFDFPILPGDSFLLCSDGLAEYLTDVNIQRTFEDEDLESAAQKFINIANEGGGHDNITAVLVRMPQAEDKEAAINKAAEINLSMEVLREINIFKYLNYQELIKVYNLTELRSYEPNQVVFLEGVEGREFFMIVRGAIRIEKGGNTVATLQDRDHFGEMALLDKAPRSASAFAEDVSKLLVINRRDFYDIIKKEHALAVKLLWSFVQVLSDRLRTTTTNLTDALVAEELEIDPE